MTGGERPVTACRSPYMPCVLSMILLLARPNSALLSRSTSFRRCVKLSTIACARC